MISLDNLPVTLLKHDFISLSYCRLASPLASSETQWIGQQCVSCDVNNVYIFILIIFLNASGKTALWIETKNKLGASLSCMGTNADIHIRNHILRGFIPQPVYLGSSNIINGTKL